MKTTTLVAQNKELSEITPTENELKNFFNLSLDLLCIANTDGYFKHINPAFTEKLGYTEQCLLSRPFIDFVHPNDKEATLAELAHLAQGAITVNFENRYRCKDNSYKWLSWTCRPDPQAGMLYTVAHDITHHKEIENNLKESELRFQLALFGTNDGVWDWMDVASDKQWWSPRYLELLGYKTNEIQPSLSEFHSRIHPDDEHRILRARRANFDEGEPFDVELRLKMKTGEYRWFRSRGNTIRDFERKPVRMAGSLRDIDERRKMELEVLKISEYERQNIGQELHDGLGSQLSGIGMICQLLARKLEKSGNPVAPEVAEIAKQIKEADYLARNIARGLVPVAPEPDGLRLALHRFAETAEHNYGISSSFKEKGDVLIEDVVVSGHLFRIVQEAFSNAVRHGKATKITIYLTNYAKNRGLSLEIVDNGKGIPDKLPKDRGVGLRTMQYRANVIGARLTINRGKGGGTVVLCQIQNTHPYIAS